MIKLELEKIIKASPQRVYQAWTQPQDLMRWHCPLGMTVSEATCTPEVGSGFSVNMVDSEGGNHRAVGTYLELTPPSKLRFTWGWEVGGGNGENTEVTVFISPVNESDTRVLLIHERFENVDGRDGHSEGWTGALVNLTNYLEGTQ